MAHIQFHDLVAHIDRKILEIEDAAAGNLTADDVAAIDCLKEARVQVIIPCTNVNCDSYVFRC